MIFQSSVGNSQRLMTGQLILAAVAIYAIDFTVYYLSWTVAFYCFLLFISHHAGLHRYFAHRSYTVNRFWHAFLAVSSCLICFGSPAGYTVIHRAHHAYTDTNRDPHSQQHLGFINIIFFNWRFEGLSMWRVMNDLRNFWLHFTHNYYLAIVLVFYAILLVIDYRLALCYSLGNALTLFAMGFINTVCHTTGATTYRNHTSRDTSSNSYFAVLIGEWHNNHHARPRQWNQHERWWEIDYAAQFIRLIKK